MEVGAEFSHLRSTLKHLCLLHPESFDKQNEGQRPLLDRLRKGKGTDRLQRIRRSCDFQAEAQSHPRHRAILSLHGTPFFTAAQTFPISSLLPTRHISK